MAQSPIPSSRDILYPSPMSERGKGRGNNILSKILALLRKDNSAVMAAELYLSLQVWAIAV